MAAGALELHVDLAAGTQRGTGRAVRVESLASAQELRAAPAVLAALARGRGHPHIVQLLSAHGAMAPRAVLHLVFDAAERLAPMGIEAGEALALDVTRALLSALAHLHAAGLTHGDVRLDSLFRGLEHGSYRLGAFGARCGAAQPVDDVLGAARVALELLAPGRAGDLGQAALLDAAPPGLASALRAMLAPPHAAAAEALRLLHPADTRAHT